MRRVARCLKNTALGSLLVLVSLIAGLAVLEVSLRLCTGQTYLDQELNIQWGALVNVPKQFRRWKRPEWDIAFKINSRGFRDYEYAALPSHSIVLLGDSFVEGYGVQLPESFGKRLERMLRLSDPHSRVYIGGSQGRNPHTYLRVYEKLWAAEKTHPLVLMGFTIANDIEEGSRSGFQNIPNRFNFSYWLKCFLGGHSVLYNFLRRPIKLSRRLQPLAARLGLTNLPSMDTLWADPRQKNRWNYTAGLINDFRLKLKNSDKDFLLILIPTREQVEDDYYSWIVRVNNLDAAALQRFSFNDFMADYARKQDLEVLDLTPAFRREYVEKGASLYFKTDSHWTPAGHALAAREIFTNLKRRGLLKQFKAHRSTAP